MLATHQLLLVGEHGVILYAPEGNAVSRAASIGWKEQDFGQKLAKACAGHSLVVLFNHADQTYRKEVGVDAQQCMKSFDKSLPDEIYPGRAMMRTTPPEDKGKATYLMVALPLLDNMRALSSALSGAVVENCAALPIESTRLVDALAAKAFPEGKKSQWSMLIGQHEMGGLRQLVTRRGELALTRLTPQEAAQQRGETWAANVAMEFNQTMTYLRRFGYEDADGVDVVVVCEPAEAKLLTAKQLPATRLRCVTVAESLTLLGCGVPTTGGGIFADDLHAAWTEFQARLTLPIPVPGLGSDTKH